MAHTATKRLAGCLADRSLSPAAEPVFFFLLLGFQHSELVFHSIVSDLPAVVGDLKASGKWGERLLLRMGEAARFLMKVREEILERSHRQFINFSLKDAGPE